MELFDTHAHLDLPEFAADRDAVLARAREAGVRAVITIGLDPASAPDTVRLAEADEGVFAAVGIHPQQAAAAAPRLDAGLRVLERLCGHPRVVAVGEAGLDFYRDYGPPEVQRRVFEAQLELAAAASLPVIIHQRRAEEEVLGLLARWRPRLPGAVLHCFTGDAALARRCAELDVYFGLGGIVTFPNGGALRQAVREVIPPERLLLETDAPFLAPQPRRGRRNEPAYVRWVAEAVASCLGLEPAALAALTTANARRLFARAGTAAAARADAGAAPGGGGP